MEINGVWVGWGLGDWSRNPDGTDRDNTVRRAKKYMRAMFRSYAGGLADSNKFDQQMYDVVCIMQDRLVDRPMNEYSLVQGNFIRGVLDLPTQLAMGFRKPIHQQKPNVAVTRPIIFSVEGHMSDMFFGPAAGTAENVQNRGLCWWKPVWYNSTALPFDNKSGVEALVAMCVGHWVEGPPVDPNNPDGPKVMWDFRPGTSWGITGFSQGAMVISEFMEQEVLNPNGRCHFRLKDFKRGLAIGNPRREKGKLCSWAVKQLNKTSSGIMDRDFVTTGTEIENKWAENAHEGDMFADSPEGEVGEYQTAIAKIITENSWFGGQATIFAKVMLLLGNVPAQMINVVKAIISAILFLARNPNPHYSTVVEAGDIEWMKGVAA